MARKPPRQNAVRDFVKQAHKCGLEPVVVTATSPDGTIRTEMRATDRLRPHPSHQIRKRTSGTTTMKLPRYVHAFIDRHGRSRFYLRRKGHNEGPAARIAMDAAIHGSLCQGARANRQDRDRRRPHQAGTVNAAVVAILQKHMSSPGARQGHAKKPTLATSSGSDGGARRQAHCACSSGAMCRPISRDWKVRRFSATCCARLKHFLKFCVGAGLIDGKSGRRRDPRQDGQDRRVHSLDRGGCRQVRGAASGRINGAAGARRSTSISGCASPTWCGSGRAISGTASSPISSRRKTSRTGGKRITVPLLEETKALIAATPVDRHRDISGDVVWQAVHRERVRQQDGGVVQGSRAWMFAATVCASCA